MKKEEAIRALRASTRWTEDRFGHFKLDSANGTKYRFKIQDTSIRFERQVLIGGTNEWFNIVSDYFKNTSLNIDPETGERRLKIKHKLVKIY